MVRTVDTDVVVLVGHFYFLRDQHPSSDIWVAFGTGKHLCYYHINTICANLGVERSWALPPFHAFTGCDTTSSFFGRSKKSAWQAWSAYPEATEAFVHIAQHPYEPISLSSEHFLTLERFTVVLYHKSSSLTTVNEARRTSSHVLWRTFPPLKMPYSNIQSGPSSKAIFGRLACLLSRIYRHQENGAGRRKTIPGSQNG